MYDPSFLSPIPSGQTTSEAEFNRVNAVFMDYGDFTIHTRGGRVFKGRGFPLVALGDIITPDRQLSKPWEKELQAHA